MCQTGNVMTKLLEQAIKRLRALPSEQQDAAAELLNEIITIDPSALQLTPEQQAEVKRRLAQPTEYASHEQVRAFFQKPAV